jgi:hypothetical protein
MDKKTSSSKYFPPLKKRDGLEYPDAGKWQRNVSFNKLQVLAKNLDTSRAKDHPDKLHSVPTPWARLLLFESALFDRDHPAHDEVTQQWRGLLGLLAMANVLGLKDVLDCRPINLNKTPEGDLKNAFLMLRPEHIVKVKDEKGERFTDLEENKWWSFDLIWLGSDLLGATSPRTIVFTAVGHQCPDVVPFRTSEGRLVDPAQYYAHKKDGGYFLAIIKQWVTSFIEEMKRQPGLEDYLGMVPSDRDAAPISRHEQIVKSLDSWTIEIDRAIQEWQRSYTQEMPSAEVHIAGTSRLSPPFDFIRPIDGAEIPRTSDLFLRGRTDVLVCFRPDRSVLLDEFNRPIENVPIRVWGGHQTNPGEPLPRTFTFLPRDVKVIVDPLALLEDALIEAEIANDAAYYLSCENNQYLLPLRQGITEYLTDKELEELARESRLISDGSDLRFELKIPLVGGRFVKVVKKYGRDKDVIRDAPTQSLAMWPDFECTNSPLLKIDDLVTLHTIVQRLNDHKNDKDIVCQRIRERLSDAGSKLLKEYRSDGDSSALRKTLCVDLNKVIESRGFYDSNAFTNVALSKEIQALVGRGLNEVDQRRLNRLLIQGAFPSAIAAFDPIFEHYFYYRSNVSQLEQVSFTPMSHPELARDFPERGRTWFMTRSPLHGFIGSVKGKQGLLLVRRNPIDAPTKSWEVGVDFGSTHTNVFYTEVDNTKNEWPVEHLLIKQRVRVLTQLDEVQILENFFGYGSERAGLPGQSAKADGLNRAITAATQLVLPVLTQNDFKYDWLPREGQVFLASLAKRNPPTTSLETEIKWNSDGDNYATRSFLRSLMFLVEAEATANGARVNSVSHAFPTAFTEELTNKQSLEWQGVKDVVGLPVNRKPLSEAVAVVRHLWAKQGALTATNAISLDIGGSTTDIALWANKKLLVQESIKIAAGFVTKYAEVSTQFGEWMRAVLAGVPFDVVLSRIDRKVFPAALNDLDVTGRLQEFVDTVKVSKGKDEVRPFLGLVSMLFSAVTYYVGLLVRKANLGLGEGQTCYLYFCGRGGQFYGWIPDAEDLVTKMFRGGLLGPAAPRTAASPLVDIRVSKFPKQEVGRGLLERHDVEFNRTEPTVTVGETGYKSLAWSDNLNYQHLERLQVKMPQLSELKELSNFVKVLQSSKFGKESAEALNITGVFPSTRYGDVLRQRISDNVAKGKNRALIEPLFITEVKVLIEMAVDKLVGKELKDLFD